jgi:methionyl-tRNA synthetase
MHTKNKILMTCALPYANGNIHVGHLLEYLQADIWNRYLKLTNHESYFVCADDTHGTPIMVESRKRNITPEQLIAEAWQQHTKDFSNFEIQFDHYSSTNSEENKNLCEFFYKKLVEKNHLAFDSIDQLYCEHDKMFLPDRFVKGTCPKCKSIDQYGDSCDKCSSTYSPKDLLDPYCTVCKNKPVNKKTEQIFFKLNDFKDYLQSWLPKHTADEVNKKMSEWFKEPLRNWDISRNAPYFGFQIPGYKDKFFYVWVDAPMGYVSSTEQMCKIKNLSFDDFWKVDTEADVYHIIGKDIMYFHTLFWPALLKAADLRSPTKVLVHGHVTVNGEKMSKSKGTQIPAHTYLKHLEATYLRYYYAAKMSSGIDDLDLNLDDFVQKVNAELIGKITNLASRGAQMLTKKLDGIIGDIDGDGKKLVDLCLSKKTEIEGEFFARNFSKVITILRELAEAGNRYFDEKAPWKTIDTDTQKTHQVLSATLKSFRIMAIYLKPILPSYVGRVEALYSEKFTWDDLNKDIVGKKISDFNALIGRIDPEKIKLIVSESTVATVETAIAAKTKLNPTSSPPATISIDDFSKIDLRVAEVLDAQEIKDADKLLRLKVSLGDLGERQIIAGIKSAYAAESLVGRKILVIANLAPRKMKFGISEGMVLAAGNGGSELFVFSPDSGAKAGDKAK